MVNEQGYIFFALIDGWRSAGLWDVVVVGVASWFPYEVVSL